MQSRSLIALPALAAPVALGAQTQGVQHGVRPPRLVLRNATVVDGNGTPARGPFDIVLEGTTIAALVPLDPVALGRGEARRPEGAVQIDATGKVVLPPCKLICAIASRPILAGMVLFCRGRSMLKMVSCSMHICSRKRLAIRYFQFEKWGCDHIPEASGLCWLWTM